MASIASASFFLSGPSQTRLAWATSGKCGSCCVTPQLMKSWLDFPLWESALSITSDLAANSLSIPMAWIVTLFPSCNIRNMEALGGIFCQLVHRAPDHLKWSEVIQWSYEIILHFYFQINSAFFFLRLIFLLSHKKKIFFHKIGPVKNYVLLASWRDQLAERNRENKGKKPTPCLVLTQPFTAPVVRTGFCLPFSAARDEEERK